MQRTWNLLMLLGQSQGMGSRAHAAFDNEQLFYGVLGALVHPFPAGGMSGRFTPSWALIHYEVWISRAARPREDPA